MGDFRRFLAVSKKLGSAALLVPQLLCASLVPTIGQHFLLNQSRIPSASPIVGGRCPTYLPVATPTISVVKISRQKKQAFFKEAIIGANVIQISGCHRSLDLRSNQLSKEKKTV